MKKFIILFFWLVIFLFRVYVHYEKGPEAPKKPEPVVSEVKPLPLTLKEVSFSELQGFGETSLKSSLEAFKISCRAFIKASPDKAVGSTRIPIKASDWLEACSNISTVSLDDNKAIQHFFETYFKPIAFVTDAPVEGLFTGYYVPYLHGSLKASKKYRYPLYQRPQDLISVNLELFDSNFRHRHLFGRVEGQRLIPYYTRKQIDEGQIKHNAKVLAYVDSDIDRLFLEIQGSGIVKLDKGPELWVGYAAQNGAAYTPIGRVLLEKGVIQKENLSMQTIKTYLLEHPDEVSAIIHQNKSFVFFQKLNQNYAYGAQGVPLTPGYSLAVDKQWIPLGAPLWLTTTYPNAQNQASPLLLNRMMIAQDTGGAIKGAVRGDVYWGAGDDATFIAGHMKNNGYYWLLIPKNVVIKN